MYVGLACIPYARDTENDCHEFSLQYIRHGNTFHLDSLTGRKNITRTPWPGWLWMSQPPPISCFSNQFLFYLNSSLATSAFDTWSHLSPAPLSCLPPERFTFDIIDMS